MFDTWTCIAFAAFLSAIFVNSLQMMRAKRELSPVRLAALPGLERKGGSPTAIRGAMALCMSMPLLSQLFSSPPALKLLLLGLAAVASLALAYRSIATAQTAANLPRTYIAASRRGFAIFVLGCLVFVLMLAAKFQWPAL